MLYYIKYLESKAAARVYSHKCNLNFIAMMQIPSVIKSLNPKFNLISVHRIVL